MNVNADPPPREREKSLEENPAAVAVVRSAGHRLGPLVSVEPLESPLMGRVYAAGLATGCAALLIVAATLSPDRNELGTHQQLGLPPCGFLVVTGLPCPTCGMTTAFALAVRGRLLSSIHAQAAGFMIAVLVAGAGASALFSVVTGKRLALNWYRINPTWLVFAGASMFLLAWGLKIVFELMNRNHQHG